MRTPWIVLSALLLSSTFAFGQHSVSAPPEVDLGAEVSISYTGPVDERDFITIVPKGTAAGRYEAYVYLKTSSPIKLAAPEKSGEYEIRMLDGVSGYPTLAMRALTVNSIEVSLEAPSSAGAGAPIEITWIGPGNPRDFITIVEVGTAEKKYGKYSYLMDDDRVSLQAPEQAGDYEIRYLSARNYLTLASRALRVEAVTASLDVAATVQAGAALTVRWEGPNNPRDFVTIVEKGAPEKTYKRYKYTSTGNPLQLEAPDKPGAYEARYLTGRDYLTLASVPIQVGGASASLDGPTEVEGGKPFEVSWTGPANPRDFITIVEKSVREGEYGHYTYTRRGSPLTITAPFAPGEYELRYSTGQSYMTLARRPIRVTQPADQPGSLRILSVAAAGPVAAGGGNAVEIILDASGSMLQRQDGQRRIDIAKQTLTELTDATLAAGTPFALRVFGHKEAGSCRTDLEIPLTPLDRAAVARVLAGIEAKNLAKTPIAASLGKILEDLRGAQGEFVVVLITDGEETCEGDPAAAIEALKAAGVDVRVNIVGFAIDQDELKGEFRYWASLGGGAYFDATDAQQLGDSLTQAVRAPFDVYNSGGQVVASGAVGGEAVAVPAGSYVVKTRTSPERTANVEIKPGEETLSEVR